MNILITGFSCHNNTKKELLWQKSATRFLEIVRLAVIIWSNHNHQPTFKDSKWFLDYLGTPHAVSIHIW